MTVEAANDIEPRKTHLEDIFIWKMSDELKLTAKEEKQFTEIHKTLNKRKFEINKELSELAVRLNDKSGDADLKNYRKLLQSYYQISLDEFDAVKKLLGVKKFIEYVKIKNELNLKMKSLLIGDHSSEKKDSGARPLPAPKVIIEKGE